MATYLLTWNPKKWHWWGDNLEDDVEKDGDMYFGGWSCGNSKNIHIDDRVFLIRLGKEPRGIVASGWADSEFYEDKHWDEELAASGKTTRYISVRLDTLLDAGSESIFPRKSLDSGILGKMHWDSQLSGIRIPDDVAAILEEEWADFLGNERKPIPIAEPSAIEGLRTETVRYIRGRSRQLRDLALRESEGICCVCDVDYREILDGKGVRVLQVHHKKQLAATDAPRVTALSDLAVVCANCHMLIHMNPKQALLIEELRDMLGKFSED
jgi:5-methylcytosine-specific restriction protein A